MKKNAIGVFTAFILLLILAAGCSKKDLSDVYINDIFPSAPAETTGADKEAVSDNGGNNENGEKSKEDAESAEPLDPEDEAEITSSPLPAPLPEAKLMFTGDLMCLSSQQYLAKTSGGYDFNSSFDYVRPIFDTADAVFGNLETLISTSVPYSGVQKELDGRPLCNGPVEFLQAVKAAGFDILATANNHTCDGLNAGIEDTIAAIEEEGFEYVGSSAPSKGEYKGYVIHEVNGIKLGVMSYTEIHNRRYDMNPEDLVTYTNCYSEERLKADIAEAKAAGAEYIIVYIHWGIEHTQECNEAQRSDALAIANAGADLIIGSHPHCLQNYDYVTTDDGRSVLTMYSMGNFVSGMAKDIHNDALILDVDIKKNDDGDVVMTGMKYITCHVFPEYDGGHHVILPTDEALNGGKSMSSLSSAHARMTEVLENRP